MLLATIWVTTHLVYGHDLSAAIPGLYQVVTFVRLEVLARSRRFGTFRTTQLVAFPVLRALLQVSLGGFVASSHLIGSTAPSATMAAEEQVVALLDQVFSTFDRLADVAGFETLRDDRGRLQAGGRPADPASGPPGGGSRRWARPSRPRQPGA